jgi:hypothetical protein
VGHLQAESDGGGDGSFAAARVDKLHIGKEKVQLEEISPMRIELSKAQSVYLIDHLQNACDVAEENEGDPNFEVPGMVFPMLLKKALKSRTMQLEDVE